jgi:hypothetical protein
MPTEFVWITEITQILLVKKPIKYKKYDFYFSFFFWIGEEADPNP